MPNLGSVLLLLVSQPGVVSQVPTWRKRCEQRCFGLADERWAFASQVVVIFKQTVAAINEWNPIYQNSSSDLWLKDVQKLQGFRYMTDPTLKR